MLSLCVPGSRDVRQGMCCVSMQGLPRRTVLPASKAAAADSNLPPFARPRTIAGGPGPQYKGGSPIARRQPPAAAGNRPQGPAGTANIPRKHAAPDAPASPPGSLPAPAKKRKLAIPTVWQPRLRGVPSSRARSAAAADQAAAGAHHPPGASRRPAAGSTAVTPKKEAEAEPASGSAAAAGGTMHGVQASGLLGAVGRAATGAAANSRRAERRRRQHMLREEVGIIDLTGESDVEIPV